MDELGRSSLRSDKLVYPFIYQYTILAVILSVACEEPVLSMPKEFHHTRVPWDSSLRSE